MSNENWKLIYELPNEIAILHNPKAATPYVRAYGYNKETNGWLSGSYCMSIDSALVSYLRMMRNENLKSQYQIKVEENSEITYDRMVELATLFKDGLICDDEESAIEYFDEECEMTEKEKKFFGIEEEDIW